MGHAKSFRRMRARPAHPVPGTRLGRGHVGRNPDTLHVGVVQCARVATQTTRITNEDLEKVAMQIGRNQRVQAHGALLMFEPTFLVRPRPMHALPLHPHGWSTFLRAMCSPSGNGTRHTTTSWQGGVRMS
jgi:hypothetical protein